MSKETEIDALIKLLDDENDEIVENVSQRLMSYGSDVIEKLEFAWESTTDTELQLRIENLSSKINFESVYQKAKKWISDSYQDLLEISIIIAKLQYPELDKDEVYTKIEKYSQKIWLELNNDLTPLEKINVFNKIFYNVLGFKGDYKTAPEISDYCINEVLKQKNGNSISLGILYIILANKLNIQVYGVNLPRHFVLSMQNSFINDFSIDNSSDTIFYINPMTKGTIFEKNEIDEYLKKINIEKKEKYYAPADNKSVVKELLNYMKVFFIRKDEDEKVEKIDRLLGLFI